MSNRIEYTLQLFIRRSLCGSQFSPKYMCKKISRQPRYTQLQAVKPNIIMPTTNSYIITRITITHQNLNYPILCFCRMPNTVLLWTWMASHYTSKDVSLWYREVWSSSRPWPGMLYMPVCAWQSSGMSMPSCVLSGLHRTMANEPS